MTDFAPKFIRHQSGVWRREAWRALLLSLFVLLFGLAGSNAAAGAQIQNPPADSSGRGLPFAIGDFDGDLRPDLASIQEGRGDCCHRDYWIEIRLTSAARQSIRLIAPMGGLQIEARDVNGDNALDLVISTAWLKQPVSILLNDGRGHFSAVDPSAFSATLQGSGRSLVPAVEQGTQAAAISPRWRNGDGSHTSGILCGASVARFVCAPTSSYRFVAFFPSNQGRAPPSEPA